MYGVKGYRDEEMGGTLEPLDLKVMETNERNSTNTIPECISVGEQKSHICKNKPSLE